MVGRHNNGRSGCELLIMQLSKGMEQFTFFMQALLCLACSTYISEAMIISYIYKEECVSVCLFFILWHICSKQELSSHRNSHCKQTALKQHLFIGNGHKTDNGTTSIARQQILNKNR
jgi:hypothetical protein